MLPDQTVKSQYWSKPGQPFRDTLQGVGVTGSDVDLATKPANAGNLYAVEGITVRDVHNAATRVEFLVGRYGVERYVGATGALVADVPSRFTDGFYISDGERLIVRFVGTTTSDALEATVEGEVRYQPPPPHVPVVVNG